jgi:bisanhydrobacterioruberin hydratase
MINKSYHHLPLFLVSSSYAFGILCIQFGFLPELVNYSWFQLLLTAACLSIVVWKEDKSNIIKYFLLSYLVGFWIEVAGVNTGLIFGAYEYGDVLGIKIWDTPIMIGINWFVTTYIINDAVSRFKMVKWLKVLFGATTITAMDYIIEPDAMRLGMWSWEGDVIPLQNYIAWWAVSLVLSYFYHTWKLKINNLAPYTLLAMLLFFLAK